MVTGVFFNFIYVNNNSGMNTKMNVAYACKLYGFRFFFL
jgi:hypothetical protein